ncbi:sensor histidine kinase [Leucobacter japonicus]|uniref:sensor histidine kinase n=1 Tax=Leucobacter japonicus TaxID=1461259 RepID=UPI000949A190|nr:sensor histidine kinase [Leucobacter japonicus]
MTVPEAPTAAEAHPLRWWDAGVALTLVVMAGAGIMGLSPAAELTATELVLTFGALVAIALWYAAVGRAALRRAIRDAPASAGDTVFLVGLVVLMGIATAIVPSYATLQAIGYPIIWTIARSYRWAVLWCAVLAVSLGFGFVRFGLSVGGGSSIGAAVAVQAVSFVFAVAMGTWITRIFAAGERHREVAEALRRSQREVASLSEAAGAAAERERLSRDLHDTLTQTLTGLVMLSEQADRALAAGNAVVARDRLDRVRSAARDSLQEARALVATTQPLGDGGLEAALERTAARLRADTDLEVRCEYSMSGGVALDREQQVMLLRAAQEGLSNARKHARAASVQVTLVRIDAEAVLRVDDDGVGPAPESADGADVGGYGLTGLADRFRGAGGSVCFGAGPKRGARLEARLPIAGAGAGAGAGTGAAADAGVGIGTAAGSVPSTALTPTSDTRESREAQ